MKTAIILILIMTSFVCRSQDVLDILEYRQFINNLTYYQDVLPKDTLIYMSDLREFQEWCKTDGAVTKYVIGIKKVKVDEITNVLGAVVCVKEVTIKDTLSSLELGNKSGFIYYVREIKVPREVEGI